MVNKFLIEIEILSTKIISVQVIIKERRISMKRSLAHTRWMCKYHIVFTPKYRRKIIYNKLRRDIVQIIKDLCKWKGIEIIEGKAMPDHIHISIDRCTATYV